MAQSGVPPAARVDKFLKELLETGICNTQGCTDILGWKRLCPTRLNEIIPSLTIRLMVPGQFDLVPIHGNRLMPLHLALPRRVYSVTPLAALHGDKDIRGGANNAIPLLQPRTSAVSPFLVFREEPTSVCANTFLQKHPRRNIRMEAISHWLCQDSNGLSLLI
jgi:hypothetical protein